LPRTRTTFAKGNPHRFKPGVVTNPNGRRPLIENLHELAREHAPEAIARLLALMRQDEERGVALSAAAEMLNRGYGRPPIAVFAQVSGEIAVSGIDAPPPIINETDEQWLSRRRQELALLEQATRREPPPTSSSPSPAASPTPPPNGETAAPGRNLAPMPALDGRRDR
jgi:hypothetical protein